MNIIKSFLTKLLPQKAQSLMESNAQNVEESSLTPPQESACPATHPDTTSTAPQQNATTGDTGSEETWDYNADKNQWVTVYGPPSTDWTDKDAEIFMKVALESGPGFIDPQPKPKVLNKTDLSALFEQYGREYEFETLLQNLNDVEYQYPETKHQAKEALLEKFLHDLITTNNLAVTPELISLIMSATKCI